MVANLLPAWVQFPLVPIRVIGGGRKDIWPKLLTCASKSPTLVGSGTSEPLNKGVSAVKFGRFYYEFTIFYQLKTLYFTVL